MPIWTWANQPCPRCHAPAERPCRTTSGRPSTNIHATRWQDLSSQYW
ncbi:zinc finger domain-containing protein [Actinoplanes cyaneus]